VSLGRTPIRKREGAAALIPLLSLHGSPRALTARNADATSLLIEEGLVPDAARSLRRRQDGSAPLLRARCTDGRMIAALPDEFQDAGSTGSLVQARRCWLDLMAAGALPLPQRFTFTFRCPSQRMAAGLTDFLRYADFAGFVRSTDPTGGAAPDPWDVAGTTHAAIWSLPSLEHLFMRLRGAGARYESALLTLNLLPAQ
jgi:hypothetical protein